MSSQLNSKRHLLDNLASLYMLWCDMQKFKQILQSNVIINILASKFVAWIQKDALSSSSFLISGKISLRHCDVKAKNTILYSRQTILY